MNGSLRPQEGDPLWLVWDYEGDFSLADLMEKKVCPRFSCSLVIV